MTKLRSLGASLILIFAMSVSAFAGDMSTPPCAPGDINTPPCASAQLATDDPGNPGEMGTPPVAETVVLNTIVDAALGAVLSVF